MIQGGVTKILTVGRSATGVKLEVKGQGLQNPSSHRSNKKLHGQETKQKLQPTIKQNEFIKSIRTYTRLYGVYNYISPRAVHAATSSRCVNNVATAASGCVSC